MTNESRPNLFSYATSELSQDAFICWLAAWADPKWKSSESALHQTAKLFLLSLIKKTEIPFDENSIRTIHITPQADRIDILIEINKDANDKLAILIEDKTHTDHHSDQLKRYFDIVNLKHSYTPDQIIPIFFKTGYQSRFDNLREFKTYLRKEFLNLLQEGSKTVTNAIYTDFLIHLNGMELAVNQFSIKPLEDWGDNDWRGFFMALYDNFGELDDQANWGYVANASGGFFGFWWDFEVHAQGDYWTYLQLEEDTLCYKIGFSDKVYETENWKAEAQKIKSIWSGILMKLDKELTDKSTKVGKTMTIAKKANGTNYLIPKTDGALDLEETIIKLLEVQTTLKEARQLFTASEQ